MGFLNFNLPASIVSLISIVIGLLMVIVFGYASNQKAIHLAKDHLKAHLLALRLFQDQIPVVLRSYGRIMIATGSYLRLAFMPLLWVALPLTAFVVQADRYLGSMPLQQDQAFLIQARVNNADVLNHVSLQLPSGLAATAPAVHIPSENEVVWRVLPSMNGDYEVKVQVSGQAFSKQVRVATGLPRLSPIRLRDEFWERMIVSGEPALPAGSLLQSIEVQYPPRQIAFAGFLWNWIWLFLVLSLVAGFLFKSILGVEI